MSENLIILLFTVVAVVGVIVAYDMYWAKKAELLEAEFWEKVTKTELEAEAPPTTITWISAEEFAEMTARRGQGGVVTKTRTNTPGKSFDALTTNPHASEEYSEEFDTLEDTPSYEVGEKIVVFNPHIMYPVFCDDYEAPEHHEILDVKWDEDDATFRYLIGGEHIWVAEDWLVYSDYPKMSKNSLTSFTGRDKVMLDLDKAFSERVTQQVTIDRALDLMNSTIEEERALGLRMLQELRSEKGATEIDA